MKIIDADPTRMINLPGVGPCPRPVDIDETVTGFKTLKSLRIYSFEAGQTIEGESEGDEVYVIPIGGAIEMKISGASSLSAILSADGVRALYMTPDHAYELTPKSPVQVAYARAAANGAVACHAVSGTTGDAAEILRFSLLDLAQGETLEQNQSGERLIHLVAGSARVNGAEASAPQTIALQKGEAATVKAKTATTLLLVHV